MSKYQVGFDVEAALRRVVGNWQLQLKEQERRVEVDKPKPESVESLYCLVKVWNSCAPESQTKIYEATTMQELPGMGQLSGRAHSIDGALIELKMNLAREWLRLGVCSTWAEARERASRVKLERELFV